MIEEVRQVAERIRGLRDIAGMSAESLAGALGMTADDYLRYESGELDIPISILYQIANLFHVELGALLTGDNPRLHVYAVVRSGKGISVDRGKRYKHESLGFNFAHKKAEPFLVTVEPQPAGAPFHLNSHPGQEFNYVLEGSLKIVVDDHEVILNEGDALYFDSSCAHGMSAMHDRPARFLAIVL